MLTSLFSQESPAHHVRLPSSSAVTSHAQTKHVRPALLALEHVPRPEHEFVPSLQASSVSKHVDTPPIGSCGDGTGGGSGDCGGWAKLDVLD